MTRTLMASLSSSMSPMMTTTRFRLNRKATTSKGPTQRARFTSAAFQFAFSRSGSSTSESMGSS